MATWTFTQMQLADFGEKVLGPERYYRIRVEDVAARRTPEERAEAVVGLLSWLGGEVMVNDADVAALVDFVSQSTHEETFDLHDHGPEVADWTARVAGPMLARFGYQPAGGADEPGAVSSTWAAEVTSSSAAGGAVRPGRTARPAGLCALSF